MEKWKLDIDVNTFFLVKNRALNLVRQCHSHQRVQGIDIEVFQIQHDDKETFDFALSEDPLKKEIVGMLPHSGQMFVVPRRKRNATNLDHTDPIGFSLSCINFGLEAEPDKILEYMKSKGMIGDGFG